MAKVAINPQAPPSPIHMPGRRLVGRLCCAISQVDISGVKPPNSAVAS